MYTFSKLTKKKANKKIFSEQECLKNTNTLFESVSFSCSDPNQDTKCVKLELEVDNNYDDKYIYRCVSSKDSEDDSKCLKM